MEPKPIKMQPDAILGATQAAGPLICLSFWRTILLE